MVSALDYVYEAMPPPPPTAAAQGLAGPHAHSAGAPQCPPRTLWTPLDRGRCGIPHLYTRMRLRHVQGFLRAMDSQGVIIRENICWSSWAWQGLDRSDHELLEHTLREVGMDVLVLPAAWVAPVE